MDVVHPRKGETGTIEQCAAQSVIDCFNHDLPERFCFVEGVASRECLNLLRRQIGIGGVDVFGD